MGRRPHSKLQLLEIDRPRKDDCLRRDGWRLPVGHMGGNEGALFIPSNVHGAHIQVRKRNQLSEIMKDEFKQYRRKQIAEMRPYTVGEKLPDRSRSRKCEGRLCATNSGRNLPTS
jgi:hypothetical protein